MKKRIWLIAITVFCSCNKLEDYLPFAHEQQPQFDKVYGGDFASAILATPGGGYLLAAQIPIDPDNAPNNHGTVDALLLKVDESGNEVWQKAYGGSDWDAATAITKSWEGGYIMGALELSPDGDVSNNHGDDDAWVVNVDKDGNIRWEKSYGGWADDQIFSILETDDGGYIFAGSTRSDNADVSGNHGGADAWVVKLDKNGKLLWQKTFGGSADDGARGIVKSTHGGYVIVGSTLSSDGDIHKKWDGSDAWVVRIDENGTIIWERTLGGSGKDAAYAVTRGSDGGYVIAATTTSKDGDVHVNRGSDDAWIVKLDEDGSILWQRVLGGSGFESIWAITDSPDEGYVIGGSTNSNDGDLAGIGVTGAWMIKLDKNGNVVWQKVPGGTGIRGITKRPKSGYVVAGFGKTGGTWAATIKDK